MPVAVPSRGCCTPASRPAARQLKLRSRTGPYDVLSVPEKWRVYDNEMMVDAVVSFFGEDKLDTRELAHLLPWSRDPRLPQLEQACFLLRTICRTRIQFDVRPTEHH